VKGLTSCNPVPRVLQSSMPCQKDRYSSVFQHMFVVEEHLKASGLSYTITAPDYFVEDAFAPWNPRCLVCGMPMPATKESQL
jgi:uncharacterized protein YbjT (DUF2867 family)